MIEVVVGDILDYAVVDDRTGERGQEGDADLIHWEGLEIFDRFLNSIPGLVRTAENQ